MRARISSESRRAFGSRKASQSRLSTKLRLRNCTKTTGRKILATKRELRRLTRRLMLFMPELTSTCRLRERRCLPIEFSKGRLPPSSSTSSLTWKTLKGKWLWRSNGSILQRVRRQPLCTLLGSKRRRSTMKPRWNSSRLGTRTTKISRCKNWCSTKVSLWLNCLTWCLSRNPTSLIPLRWTPPLSPLQLTPRYFLQSLQTPTLWEMSLWRSNQLPPHLTNPQRRVW